MKPATIAYIALAIILAFGVGAGGSWWLTDNYVTARYEAQISKANEDAAEKLAKVTAEKNDAETKLQGVRNDVDKEYRETIAGKDRTIAGLRADNVKLRDPGYKNPGNTCPTDSGIASGPPAALAGEGTLSEEATGFLLDFAGEADDTLEQLRACRAWSENVKSILDQWNKDHPGTPIKIKR